MECDIAAYFESKMPGDSRIEELGQRQTRTNEEDEAGFAGLRKTGIICGIIVLGCKFFVREKTGNNCGFFLRFGCS